MYINQGGKNSFARIRMTRNLRMDWKWPGMAGNSQKWPGMDWEWLRMAWNALRMAANGWEWIGNG
jgi:hypothetical protein